VESSSNKYRKIDKNNSCGYLLGLKTYANYGYYFFTIVNEVLSSESCSKKPAE